MTLAHSLLFAGGVFHIGLIVFHLKFARLFHWDTELGKLDFINRQIPPVMNNVLILLFAGLAWLSFVYTDDLLFTDLGRALLIGIAVIWLFRAALQVVYFRLKHWVSWLLFYVFSGGALLYAAAWFYASGGVIFIRLRFVTFAALFNFFR